MSAKRKHIKKNWIDPDDAPELTPDLARRAQISHAGDVVREATGTLTKRGRPPIGDEPKRQVTLRLAPKVINYFKQGGEGWQTRLNQTLEKYVIEAVTTRPDRGGTVSMFELMSETRAKAKTKQSTNTASARSAGIGRNATTGRLTRSGKASVRPKRTDTKK